MRSSKASLPNRARPSSIAPSAAVGIRQPSHLLAGPSGLIIGIDVDPNNLEFARARLNDSACPAPCPVRFFHANFSEIDEVLAAVGRPKVDLILADLGLSTNQFFDARYGLSFSQYMPLDMRIDPRLSKSAADLVHSMREEDLANVLYELAQERYSRRIARKIVEARRLSPINTTDRLAELVRSAIPIGVARRRSIPPPGPSWPCAWPSIARWKTSTPCSSERPTA